MKEKTKKMNDYTAPSLKVVSFTVEQGFAGSEIGAPRAIGTENMVHDVDTDVWERSF